MPVVEYAGPAGDPQGYVFAVASEAGEDRLAACANPACGYLAEIDLARFARPPDVRGLEEPAPLQKVATPGTKTIAALAELLDVPEARTAKAVFYMATLGGTQTPRFVFAVLRGDMEVSERKLAEAIGADNLWPATDAEIEATGAAPGYASPIGIRRQGILVVADELIPLSPNLVAGANETGYHLLNTVYGRDYTADVVADIALLPSGAACPGCGYPLSIRQATVVARLGTMAAKPKARDRVTWITTASPGRSRWDGVRSSPSASWPRPSNSTTTATASSGRPCVAPYDVHLTSLASPDDAEAAVAASLYDRLAAAGLTVLFDDRDERPGVKFKDADLIGLPARVTIGARSLREGGAELKWRDQPEKQIVALEDLVKMIAGRLAQQ